MFYSSLHQHMKKPFDNLLTFHLYMCTPWMFTCQSTPRISPRTSVKTCKTTINHPQDARRRLPPAAQHRAPGFCLSDACRIGCQATAWATAVWAKLLEKKEGNACRLRQFCDASAWRYFYENDSDRLYKGMRMVFLHCSCLFCQNFHCVFKERRRWALNIFTNIFPYLILIRIFFLFKLFFSMSLNLADFIQISTYMMLNNHIETLKITLGIMFFWD